MEDLNFYSISQQLIIKGKHVKDTFKHAILKLILNKFYQALLLLYLSINSHSYHEFLLHLRMKSGVLKTCGWKNLKSCSVPLCLNAQGTN